MNNLVDPGPGGVSPPRAQGVEAPVLIIEEIPAKKDEKSNKRGHHHRGSHHSSRSRSRSKRSKRRRSSSRSSNSSSSSLSKSSPKSVDEATKKANEELDTLVEEFLDEEKRMLAFMDGERHKFLTRPESHRHYTEEWGIFYREKCRQERTSIHPSMLKNEWIDVWERFVAKEHRVKTEDEGIRLMRKYGIRNDDIRDYHIRKKKRLLEAEKNRKPEEVAITVINSLRLLSAIEHLMDSLGQQVMAFFATAKSLEAKGGDAKELLQKQDFVDFCHFSKELLMRKLTTVPEKQAKAVRTCIDNIAVLLQQTALKANVKSLEDAVNVDKYQDPLQVQIAQTIINLYKSNGKFITQEELDDLVNSEFNRIQEKQRPPVVQQPLYYEQQPHEYYERDTTYYDQQPPASTYDQQRPAQQPPASTLASSINWSAIQSAVQLVSSVQSTASEPAEIPPEEVAPAAPEVQQQQQQQQPEDDGYDDLSIEELTSLFKNFKQLDKDTQAHLIAYMQRLEKTNPAKVVQLKTFINAKKGQ